MPNETNAPQQELAAYRAMQAAVQEEYDRTADRMATLKAQGKEKTATYRQLFAKKLAVGGGFHPAGRFQLLHLGGGVGVLGLHRAEHGFKGGQSLLRRLAGWGAHSSTTPAWRQMRSVSSSQRLTCTSPTWALPSSSIHSRL